MVCNVALIGVGLVGSQVVAQLSSPSLSKIFRIISLSNSKHTLSLSPSASPLAPAALLALLPPSSASLPTSCTHPGATYSPAAPATLIPALAAAARASKTSTILIDCTSDLAVTELYPLAISSGLSVVTPNKKGFSSSNALWEQILEAQQAPGAGLVYLEATVGAGLPIISTLRDLVKTGDEVTKIEGVLSGTLSYIFNEFSKPGGSGGKGQKFSEIVKIAKANGYTVRLYLSSLTQNIQLKQVLKLVGAPPGGRPLRLGRRAQAHYPLAPALCLALGAPVAPRAARGLRVA